MEDLQEKDDPCAFSVGAYIFAVISILISISLVAALFWMDRRIDVLDERIDDIYEEGGETNKER